MRLRLALLAALSLLASSDDPASIASTSRARRLAADAVTIETPGFTTIPSITASLNISEGAAAKTLWPYFNAVGAFVNGTSRVSKDVQISEAYISIISGCSPADKFGVGSVGSSGLFATANSPTCPANLRLRSSALLSSVLSAIRSITFSTSSNNTYPAALLRVIRVTIDTYETAFFTLAVIPTNDPVVGPARATLDVPEGVPDFGVVIRATCSGTASSLFGLPVFCFTDADAPFYRAAPVADAYVGAATMATAIASAYNVSFDSVAVVNYTCAVQAGIAAVGSPVYDCSEARPATASPSTPVACFFQRFRLLVGSASVAAAGTAIASGPCTNCMLDAQAAYCDDDGVLVAASKFPEGLTLTARLNISDNLVDDAASPVLYSISTLLRLVSGAPLAAAFWPDSSVADVTLLLHMAPPFASSPAVLIDDSTGNATGAVFLVCWQALVDPWLAGAPLEGPAARTASWTSVEAAAERPFKAVPAGVAVRVLLSDVPTCARLLRNGSMAVAPQSSNAAAWTWVQNFTIASTGGVDALRAMPLRAYTAVLTPPAGSSLTIPINVTRSNRKMAWVNSSASISERTVGADAFLSVADGDEGQDVSFRVIRVAVDGCISTRPTARDLSCVSPSPSLVGADWAGLFSVAQVPRSVSIFDAATGIAQNVNATRTVRLYTPGPSLDLFELACATQATPMEPSRCTLNVTLEARDSVNVSAMSSLLPSAISTTALANITVTVNSAPPTIKSVMLPAGGLSARGGDVIILSGTGLDGGVAGMIGASLVNDKYDPPARFVLSCNATQTLSQLYCISSAGWGDVKVQLFLGGGGLAGDIGRLALNSYYPSIRYRPPTLVALAESASSPPTWSLTLNATNATALLANAASVYALTKGDAVPATAPPGATFSALLTDVPDNTALENAGQCAEFAAVLALENGTFVPAGRCVLADTPVDPLTLGGPNISKAAALDSGAAWVVCPIPPLSAGVLRRVAVSAQFLSTSSDSCATAMAPEPSALAYASAGAMPEPFRNVALLLPAAARASTPVVSNISQPTPGGTFYVSGANFGSSAVADDGDVVEYAAVLAGGAPHPRCAALPTAYPAIANVGFSCAVLRATCTYVRSHAQLACEMDADGWGRGYRVRVVVRGAASAWSAGTISYAVPRLVSVRAISIPGVFNDTDAALYTTLADTALEGTGGGLLLLRGENLWPPHALVITVGGVRVHAVDARPLAGSARAAPVNCNPAPPTPSPTPSPTGSPTSSPTTSASQSLSSTPTPSMSPSKSPTTTLSPTPSQTPSMTGTATPTICWTKTATPSKTPSQTPSNSQTPSFSPTGTQTPSTTMSLTPRDSCFGDSSTHWAAARRPPAAFLSDRGDNTSTVIVVAPPGFGTVTVVVAVGNSSTNASITYRQPVLRSVDFQDGDIFSTTGDLTLLIQASSLSPCLLCVPRAGSRPPLVDPGNSTCAFLKPSRGLLTWFAAGRARPVSESGEGALPAPLSTFSIDGCAMPDRLLSSDRRTRRYPEVLLRVSGVEANATEAHFSSASGSDDLSIKTPLRKGIIVRDSVTMRVRLHQFNSSPAFADPRRRAISVKLLHVGQRVVRGFRHRNV